MPRLDAERLATWRLLTTGVARLERAVDAALVGAFDITLEQFEVLGALQRADGSLRLHELSDELAAVASSLSRRIDRMEDNGWVTRARGRNPSDGRAVAIVLTREGRDIWRDANVMYRRMVQNVFARHLSETDLHALGRVFGKVGEPEPVTVEDLMW
jgi:DNA-binding MarR family transcriptional regulator